MQKVLFSACGFLAHKSDIRKIDIVIRSYSFNVLRK